MHEKVLALIIWGDEAEALAGVEPLDLPGLLGAIGRGGSDDLLSHFDEEGRREGQGGRVVTAAF